MGPRGRAAGGWLGLVLALVLWSSALRAAPTATPGELAVARALYQRGTQHYRLTEYAAALADFTEAYRVVPQPAFLYNIAQAHRELGHFDDALKFYRSYLAASRTDDPERPSIEARVRELEVKIADRDTARADAAKRTLAREAELARTQRLEVELALKLADRPAGRHATLGAHAEVGRGRRPRRWSRTRDRGHGAYARRS